HLVPDRLQHLPEQRGIRILPVHEPAHVGETHVAVPQLFRGEHANAAMPRVAVALEREVHLGDAGALGGFAERRFRALGGAAEEDGVFRLHRSVRYVASRTVVNRPAFMTRECLPSRPELSYPPTPCVPPLPRSLSVSWSCWAPPPRRNSRLASRSSSRSKPSSRPTRRPPRKSATTDSRSASRAVARSAGSAWLPRARWTATRFRARSSWRRCSRSRRTSWWTARRTSSPSCRTPRTAAAWSCRGC